MTSRPNIILITTDQQRFDSLHLHGADFINTPNMDRLGHEGVSFARAYCPNTVCTPSRVSLMTGLHLSRHGSYNIGTYTTNYSGFLSTILRNEGYRTHHIGKAHWHPIWAESPENREVDENGTPFRDFAGFETAEVCVGHSTFGITGHYKQWVINKGFELSTLDASYLFNEVEKTEFARKSPPAPPASDPNETGDWNLPVALHSGQWVAERATDFLRHHVGQQPFFLNLGFQDPHHPHVLPRDYANRVDPADIPLPECDVDTDTGQAEHVRMILDGELVDSRFNGKFVMAGNVRHAWRPYFRDEAKTRATRAYYYSMVQLIDEQLGQILAVLDERGLADSTMIIFTSDHGEMLGDHSIGQKGPLVYEGVTHIPLLMRYPNGFAPSKAGECVSLVDVLPTVLDFAGIDDSVKRDGISLKPRLAEGTPIERKGVRIEYKEEPDRIRYKCWVTPHWKLAVYLGESFGELYDLQNDPGEKHNLFDAPEYREVKTRLLVELLNDMERSEPVCARPSRA